MYVVGIIEEESGVGFVPEEDKSVVDIAAVVKRFEGRRAEVKKRSLNEIHKDIGEGGA